MRWRLAILLVAIGFVAPVSAPVEARAADPVVARDTAIHRMWALDGDLVYGRAERGATPKRPWMARFRGRLTRRAASRARAPSSSSRSVISAAIARDARS